MKRRTLLGWMSAIAFALVSSGVATAATLAPLRVGLVRGIKSGALYIAAAKGYMAKEGLDMHLIFLPSDAAVVAQVIRGNLDVGVSALDSGFYRSASRNDLRIFAAQCADQSGYPGNTLMVARKAYTDGLRGWSALAGKRLGIAPEGAGVRYALAQILAKYGVDIATITLVTLDTRDKQQAALARGEVDAAIVDAATAIALRATGKAYALRRLGDELPWQESAVFARAVTIANRRSDVEKFVRGYRKGAAEYDQSFMGRDDGSDVVPGPSYAQDLALIATQAHVAPAALESLLPWCDRAGRLLLPDVQTQVEYWQGRGVVDTSVSPATLLDLSLIDEHIGTLR